MLPLFCEPADGPRLAALLRRAMALGALVLVAATWRLWTPQHLFPQVPLVGAAGRLPELFDWLGLAAMLVGLAGSLFAPQSSRWATAALGLFAAGTVLMVAIDGERLQPWAYQFLLMAIVLAAAEARGALALLRLLVISFYFHSALTKLDYAFLHSLGEQFLAALIGTVGGTLDDWSESWRIAGAAIFPLGELLVAGGLCFARTRTAALVGAVGLHLLLLVILGPWGLDHRPGVLLWNAYFIVQDVLLFARWRPRAEVEAATTPQAPLAVRALVVAAALLPFLAPTAWFDMWPSWGLYAASAERVGLLVHRRELDGFPDALRQFVEEPSAADDPWLTVRLDRWCLETLGAPIYPQSRHQLGVAEAVIARYARGQRARVVRLHLADRFTGERAHDIFTSLPQLQATGDEYYFNTRPRMRTFAPFDGRRKSTLKNGGSSKPRRL